MLLVSAEKRGSVSRPVGGGSAASAEGSTRSPQQQHPLPRPTAQDPSTSSSGRSWGSSAPPPIDLDAGQEHSESLVVQAGAKASQRYVVRSRDHISWVCKVKDGYTVDLVVKVCVSSPKSEVNLQGRPLKLVGVDKSRLLSERERGTTFHGCLDLAGEHADCLVSAPDCDDQAPLAVLVVEIDNTFSYFTGKDVLLQVVRKAHAAPVVRVLADSPAVVAPAEPAAACGPVETAAASPASTEVVSVPEDPFSRTLGQSSPCPSSASLLQDDVRLTRLRTLLKEAMRLCPPDCSAREHLAAAQAKLEDYAEVHCAEDDMTSGVFG